MMKHAVLWFWLSIGAAFVLFVCTLLLQPEWTTLGNGENTIQDFLFLIGIAGIALPMFFAGFGYYVRFSPPDIVRMPFANYWRRPENFPLACQKLFSFSLLMGSCSAFIVIFVNLLILSEVLTDDSRVFIATAIVGSILYVALWVRLMIGLWWDFRPPKQPK